MPSKICFRQEYIPDFLISESSLHKDTFEYIEAVADMDEDRANAFEIYCKDIAGWPDDNKDFNGLLEGFSDHYNGHYGGPMKEPEVEYAYQYVEDAGHLSDVSPTIERYFDYEAFSKDLFLDGYTQIEGHVFSDYKKERASPFFCSFNS